MYMYVGKNSIIFISFYFVNFVSFGVIFSYSFNFVNSEVCGQLLVSNIGYKCFICFVRFNIESDRSLYIYKMYDKKCFYCIEVFSFVLG